MYYSRIFMDATKLDFLKKKKNKKVKNMLLLLYRKFMYGHVIQKRYNYKIILVSS